MTEVTERPEYGSHESSSKLKHPRDVEAGEYGSDKSESSKRPRPAFSFNVEPDMIIDNKEILEKLEKGHLQRCEEALNHHRDTKGLDYEVVELVKCEYVHLMPLICWHYNFKAKKRALNSGRGRGGLVGGPIPDSESESAPASAPGLLSCNLRTVSSSSLRDDDDDDSPKLFYADFMESSRNLYRLISVMQCEILDPSGLVGNCLYCKNGVLHPTNLVGHDEVPFWIPVNLLPDV